MLIKTRRFELEVSRVSVFIRIGQRSWFFGDDGLS